MIAFAHHRRAVTSALYVYDADTVAYMNATGIPDTSDPYYSAPYLTTGRNMWRSADALIRGLKTNNLWLRMALLYPSLGNANANLAPNARNPAVASLVISAGADARGLRFNGTTQSANTQYSIANLPTGGGYALDYWSADNTIIGSGDPIEIGGGSGAGGTLNFVLLAVRSTSGFAIGRASNGGPSVSSTNPVTDSRGLFTIDRNAAGNGTLYRNGQPISAPVAMGPIPTNSTEAINLGQLGGGYGFSNRGCSFACYRQSFTPDEMVTYYSLVQAFQAANFRAA